MIDKITLLRLSDHLGVEVLAAHVVGRELIGVLAWMDGRYVRTLVHDPGSWLGWMFLPGHVATWRAAGLPSNPGEEVPGDPLTI